jgi:hypothetical protein
MLHFTMQLIITAPILGALGLLLTETSMMERVATPVSRGLVDAAPAVQREPPSERVSLVAKAPCSVGSSQAETDAATKTVNPEMEFDDPFYVTSKSLNYIDRTTGSAPVHHFNFNDSSALRITAKVGTASSIAGTYAANTP